MAKPKPNLKLNNAKKKAPKKGQKGSNKKKGSSKKKASNK